MENESPFHKISEFVNVPRDLKKRIDLRALFPGGVQLASLPPLSMINDCQIRSRVQRRSDLLAIMNRFIVNIYNQDLQFQGWSWRFIVQLFNMVDEKIRLPLAIGETEEERSKKLRLDELRIELLLMHSMMDAREVHASIRGIRDDQSSVFEGPILRFVNDSRAELEVVEAEPGYEQTLKNQLKSGPIIRAVQLVMSDWDGCNEMFRRSFTETPDWITSAIDGMRIYVSSHGYGYLRGGIVKDGIYISKNALAGVGESNSKRSDADRLTLAVYLLGHYLPRKLLNDFCADTSRSKNLGAEIEKKLFGGISPNWHLIEAEKAQEFTDRIGKQETTLPVVGVGEHDDFRKRQHLISFPGQLVYKPYSIGTR